MIRVSEKTKKINHDLAMIAKETNLMIATGSVSAALKDPALSDSYTIMRDVYPEGKILANVGAGTSLARVKEAIELFQADALQLHLNAPQELVMPEGDRDFSNWKELIKEISEGISVPLIVKEVGFGMTRETIDELAELGVQTIDISGRSGTSFTQIENARRKKRELDYLVDWGQSTVTSLLEANEAQHQVEILASGGIRNAFDLFKALCLGANAVGVSGTILTMVGAKTIQELHHQPLILSGTTKDWCEARGIPLTKYGTRKK